MKTLKISLSARMNAVAAMVTVGNRVCDVGCDHGYVSIFLVQKGIAPGAVAMDINKGPLERAREHVQRAGLENYITLRLSDGLAGYQVGEAKTLICAGMGGPLMRRILNAEPAKTRDFKELILQPQSEIADFRKFLREEGYCIAAEDMIYEDGMFYPIIKAVPGEAGSMQSEVEDRYGPLLLQNHHPVLCRFLEQEWKTTQELLQQMQQMQQISPTDKILERQAELSLKLIYLRKAGEICKMGGMK